MASTYTSSDGMARRQGRVRDAAALALILGFALALCAPVLVGRVPVASDTLYLWAPWSRLPHDPVHNEVVADSAVHYLSWLVYSRQSIADGEWPLWDPHAFAGFPYVANSQNQLYYPLTWLRWLLPLSGAIQLLPIFNICVAGWGMYVLVRWFGVSRPGSLVAALSFAGSGMMQLAIEAPWVSSVYCWLPFMLYGADRALQGKGWLWVALGAVPCGLQAVAGNLQWVLYSYFAIACWTLYRVVERLRPGGLRESLATLVRGGMVLLGGLALAAVHLLPFFELVSQTTRTEGRVSSNSWPLSYLLRLVMPEYFNTAAPGVGPPMVFNDLWAMGIVPLLLAVIALPLRPRTYVWFWWGMILFALLVTFGVGPFLYVRWIPGLHALLPVRIGYLLIFSVALLAGLGYDAWLRFIKEKRRAASLLLMAVGGALGSVVLAAWLGQVGEADAALHMLKANQVSRGLLFSTLSLLALAAPMLAGIRRQRLTIRIQASALAAVMVAGVLAMDLLSMVPGYNTFVRPDELMPAAPSVAWLKAQPGAGRVMGVDSGEVTFNPNTQSLYGFDSVDGYDSFHWRRYEDYWIQVDPSLKPPVKSNLYFNLFFRPQAYTSTLASLLNVRYVAATAELATPLNWTRVYSNEILIYENPSAMPRVFLIGRASIIPSSEVRAKLASTDFDPRSEVLLEKEEEPPDFGITGGVSQGKAQVRSYRRNSVTVEVDAAENTWLVLADPNYPGWTARVDGIEQKVYTANYLLRGVPIAAGRHSVEFSYWPTNYSLAILVSITAVIVLSGVAAFSVIRRRDAH
jgi:hypothetical protein